MSMMIYPAYLLKDNAKFEDIEPILKELRVLKEKFVPYVVDKLLDEKGYLSKYVKSNYFSSPEAVDKMGYHGAFYEAIVAAVDSYHKGMILDIMCNAVVYFHNNKIVLHCFTGTVTKDFFKDNLDYKDYSLWDIYAGEDEITEEMEKEYEEKKDFYDTLFTDTGIPSNVGLVFEIFQKGMIYDIQDAISEKLFGSRWKLPFLKV